MLTRVFRQSPRNDSIANTGPQVRLSSKGVSQQRSWGRRVSDDLEQREKVLMLGWKCQGVVAAVRSQVGETVLAEREIKCNFTRSTAC